MTNKYYFSALHGVVKESETPNLNKTRIYGATPSQAIERYFADAHERLEMQKKEALIALSKETMAKAGKDRD